VFAWASPTLFDSDKFAARARQALDDSPALRRVVARTLVINVVETQKADLIAFRPLLITTAEAVVGTDAFGDVFELAARHAHELFTDRPGSNVVLRANEAALLLIDTVRTVAPDVADRIPVDGFLLANQEEGIARQLRNGVRGFQIDAYRGTVRTNGGVRVVFTDLTDAKLAEIAAATTPELAQQALQFRAVVGPPPENARQDVYLCHNFCELGAVKMSDEVDVIRRFLERNPNEVLLIVVQDELDAQELDTVLRRGGLTRYLATIDPDRSMPTLASLIASGRRVVLGLENGRLGRQVPNVFADGLVQEVPYNDRTVAELAAPDACRPLHGQPDAPLFQFNHWVTPASRGASRQVNAKEFLLGRAERCAEERDIVPNLVAVDFYKTGDLFRVVEELNAGA
jgi:hypothetical protein